MGLGDYFKWGARKTSLRWHMSRTKMTRRQGMLWHKGQNRRKARLVGAQTMGEGGEGYMVRWEVGRDKSLLTSYHKELGFYIKCNWKPSCFKLGWIRSDSHFKKISLVVGRECITGGPVWKQELRGHCQRPGRMR